MKRHAAIIAVTVLATAALARSAETGIEAIARPSKEVILGFTQPGRISEVHVTEGDEIEPNALIMRLDDRAERAQLAQLQAQAEDDTHVEAGRARLQQKKVELQRKKQAEATGAVTALEIEQSELDVTIAELSLRLAEF